MKSKRFAIHELVDKDTFALLGDGAWGLVSWKIIETIDKLKEVFPLGSMTINNYFWGGSREWSGLRTPDSPYYSAKSMHSMQEDGVFKAVDIVFSKYTAQNVREFILSNQDMFPLIRRMEDGVSWVHIDVKTTNKTEIVMFKA